MNSFDSRVNPTPHSSPIVRPLTQFWSRIGLGTKAAFVVILGMVSVIGMFGYLGTAALSENTQRNLQERVLLAQMTASYIDALLANVETVLTYTATEETWSDPHQIQIALERTAHRLSRFASHVFLVDTNGNVIAAQPPVQNKISFGGVAPVTAVIDGSLFAVSHVTQSFEKLGPSVIAAAQIWGDDGASTGALVIILNFSDPNIRAFSNPIGLGRSGYMDLVALDGRILASTRASRVDSESDHRATLMGMIRDHRPSVSACHDCHTPLAEASPQAEVLAFAPLERVQWGITVRQTEEEVFAPTRLLQNRMLSLLIFMLASALVLVYFATRSVIVPVKALTAATRRIAEGDLDSPINPLGRDEVGELAQSFDEMRIRLKNSTAEIQAWNRDLDARVQERTRAYEAAAKENARLYAELSRKEQSRGELLRQVISAQEDERKRIARELHDETSQGLTALMVGIDTARIAFAQDAQKAGTHLTNCKGIGEALLKNIHRLIADLRPSLLDDLGLVPAIAWYGQRLNPMGIALHLSEEGLKTRLPQSIETALFRIVQEAITNIIRHSQATMVNVRYIRESDYVTVKISDNGKGFDPQKIQPSEGQGLGLRGMQERASILSGEFQMQTAPGKGTTITIRAPVLD